MLKLKRTVLYQLILLCTFVLAPFAARAGTISVTSAGNSSFTLMASGFDAPAGFQLNVNYDTARLSNPRVTQGSLTSGGMFVSNPNAAGVVQIAVVHSSAMKGSGPIATINFDLLGDSAGTVSVSGTAINLASKNLPVNFVAWSSTSGSGDPGTADTTTTTTTTTATTTTPPTSNSTTTTGGGSTGIPFVVGGTLTMPSDDSATRDYKDTAAAPPQQPVQQEVRDNSVPTIASTDAPAVSEAPVAKKKTPAEPLKPIQSVLEKFRLFAGEKTPKNLIALFDRDPAASFSQLPPICIADGKTAVQVVVSKVPGDKAPNFAFNHARYQSLRQAGDGEWLIGVLPDPGVVRASISMLTESGQQEIPLVVAAPARVDLTKPGTVTEADFQLFLKTRGADSSPKYDLNADGKRDYLDDYIFTANYLAAKSAAAQKEIPAQKK